MTDLEILRRDRDTLLENVRNAMVNCHQKSPTEIRGVLEHLALLMTELAELKWEIERHLTAQTASGALLHR